MFFLLSGWSYRKTVSISPATGIANLQVKVVLTTTNFNYSNAKANGDDLRFTDTSDVLQDYWIETWNASGDSTIWVEVKTSGTSSLYLYFGNSSASAVSSGANTFIQFDDFNDASITGWTQHAGNGIISETSGVMRLSSNGNACTWWSGAEENAVYVYRARPATVDFVVEAKISANNKPSTSHTGIALTTNNDNATTWGVYNPAGTSKINLEKIEADTGGATGLDITDTSSTGKLAVKVIRDSSAEYLFDETSAGKYGFGSALTNIALFAKTWTAVSLTSDFDYFFVRQFPLFYEPWDSYDTDLWTDPQPASATIVSNELKVTSTGATETVYSDEVFFEKTMKARIKVSDNVSNIQEVVIGFRTPNICAQIAFSDTTILSHTHDGTNLETTDWSITPDTSYHNVEIAWTSNSVKFYYDGVLKATHTIYLPTTSNSVTVLSDAKTSTTINTYVNWIKVERAEPTITPAVASLGWKDLTDSIGLSETIIKSVERDLTDSTTLTDSISKFPAKTLSDTINLTDEISKKVERDLTDSISLTDSLSKNPIKNVSDAINLTESFAKKPTKNISDTVNLTDDDVRKITVVKLDTISISDSISKKPIKTLADSTTITDSILKKAGKTLSDTTTLIESFAKKPTKNISDIINISDDDVRKITVIKSDTVGVSDVIQKTISRDLTDTISTSDSIIKTPSKTLSDTTNLTELFAKKPTKNISDTVNVSDDDKRSIIKTLTDTISTVETFSKRITISLTDSVTLTDSIKKTAAKTLSDAFTFAETFAIKAMSFLDITVEENEIFDIITEENEVNSIIIKEGEVFTVVTDKSERFING